MERGIWNLEFNMDEFVYGRQPIWETLQVGKRSLHKLWVAERLSGGVIEKILQAARQRGVAIQFVRREILDNMAPDGNHQGIIAQVSATVFRELEEFLRDLPEGVPALVVALDEIQDPQNVGAILRSSGFFGVKAAILPRWRSAPVGETAFRVSSGGAEHVEMIRVRNLVEAMEQLKEARFEVYGADMAGEPLGTIVPGKRVALVVGSEGKGLRRLVSEHCDKLIAIPGCGRVDSLNVASATAIVLYTFAQSMPR